MTPTRVVLLAAGVVGVIVVAKKYLTPGEVPEPPRPIESVGTSTAARASDEPEKGHDDAFDLLHPHGRSPEEKKPEKP